MLLKISSITNLTDARYFSAIGANYLGFNFDALNENNISIQKATEISSWLHQPVIVGEFGMHQTKEEIEFIAQQLQLNEIQIPFQHAQKDELEFPKFLVVDDWSTVHGPQSTDIFVLKINEEEINNIELKKIISLQKIIIEMEFTTQNILSVVEKLNPYGIQITCKKEEKPGSGNIEDYADVLELIGFS
ncbi:MAG: hypothetical protein JWN78_245 [Bacteroidota bacterium]|nr:hypothetical protein [Bacteroidota bacterium]